MIVGLLEASGHCEEAYCNLYHRSEGSSTKGICLAAFTQSDFLDVGSKSKVTNRKFRRIRIDTLQQETLPCQE